MLSWGRGILAVAIAALAFVLTCAGLNRLIAWPEMERVIPKLGFFQEHRDDFDTLFVGSSHVRHQIAPAIFDRTTRAAGHPTRSFNLGLNAMLPPENAYVLDQILKAKPRNLKWVFVELDELERNPFPGTAGTLRALYWHDWERTVLLIRAVLRASPDEGALGLLRRTGQLLVRRRAPEERDLLLFHSVLFAKNFANVGQQSNLARWVTRLWKKGKPSSDLGPGGDGYVPLNKEMPASGATSDQAEMQPLGEGEGKFVSVLTERVYRQMADEVRRAGAVPIFLVTPNNLQTRLEFRPESGVAATVISFNNAKAYPQLYRKGMRIDPNHLKGAASEEFTKLLADDFLQRVQQDQIR
jgi:hypothetical protein